MSAFPARRPPECDGRMTHLTVSDEPIEARTLIETADGPLEVIARSRGPRWWVTARCGERSATGIGPDLGQALLAALDLSPVSGSLSGGAS